MKTVKSNNSTKSLSGFKSLGKNSKIPTKPSFNILDSFDNDHQDSIYLVPLRCNEFTAICPMTGQPDFASIEIIYVPRVKMVESKSLKLYLFSFRNHGEFHEEVTNRMFKDLWRLMDPKFMRIIADFSVRGGISIKPIVQKFAQDCKDPDTKEQIKELMDSWDKNKNYLKD